MSVDPVDDCTFWYTNEYTPTGSWATQIAAFKFDSCSGPPPPPPTPNYTLTVTKAGSGSGTVTSTPAGISCGATCAESFVAETAISLAAVADAGSFFAGFSGAAACVGGTFSMSSDVSCTATFGLGTPTPAPTPSAGGAGVVSYHPNPLDLNGDGRGDIIRYSMELGGATSFLENGTFARAASRVAVESSTHTWSAGWTIKPGDFNGDGKTDLFFYNEVTGAWFKGTSTTPTLGPVPGSGVQDTNYRALDLDASGRSATIVYNAIAGGATIFSMAAPPAGQAAAPDRSADGVWSAVDERTIQVRGQRIIVPSVYRTVQLDRAALDAILAQAPIEFTTDMRVGGVTLTLPMPDGTFPMFRIEESSIMEPGLAAQFPELRTYRAQGIDDPTASARFDLTPDGFHGIILSANGTVYIDPYSKGDATNYITYDKADYQRGEQIVCLVGDQPSVVRVPATAPITNGTQLRTYRLALAATGEHTAFHGGTVGGAMAAMTTTMNRVNGIYERAAAVRMTLVANNNLIIYTDGGTDPYTNNSGGAMLSQNQTTLDTVIGSANYDIGHVFSTGGGGVASLQSSCNPGSKALGVTGSSRLLKNSAEWDRQIDPGDLRCSQHF